MKKVIAVIVMLAIVSGGLFFSRAHILKKAIMLGVEYALGAPVKIGDIEIDTGQDMITLKDFKLYNPKGFPEGILMTAPEIKVTYHEPVIVKSKIHLLQVVMDLDEVVVVKNKNAKMNVDSLRGVKDPDNIPQLSDKQEYDKSKRIHIDTFTLSVKRVVYKDYTAGSPPPAIQVFDVDIRNKTYQNIPGVQTLVLFTLNQAMTKTAIKGAAIYGVAAVAGIGFWPAGAAIIVLGNDSAQGTFEQGYDDVFRACADTIEQEGHITSQSKEAGNIDGGVKDATVSVKVKKNDKKINVVVSARKVMLLPNPKLAKTLLYVISEKLTEE